jgi:hypothetical protein
VALHSALAEAIRRIQRLNASLEYGRQAPVRDLLLTLDNPAAAVLSEHTEVPNISDMFDPSDISDMFDPS